MFPSSQSSTSADGVWSSQSSRAFDAQALCLLLHSAVCFTGASEQVRRKEFEFARRAHCVKPNRPQVAVRLHSAFLLCLSVADENSRGSGAAAARVHSPPDTASGTG